MRQTSQFEEGGQYHPDAQILNRKRSLICVIQEAFSAVWLPFLNKRQTNVAGGNKKIHEHPNAGTSTFANRPEDINREGRPVSIRNQLKRLLEQDGKVTVPASQVDKVNDDGSVTLILPTQDQLAMKLLSWALSKKGVDSIKAIQILMEQIDGKPKQEIDMTSKEPIKFVNPDD